MFEFDSALRLRRSAPLPGFPEQLLAWHRNRVSLIWVNFGLGEPLLGNLDLLSGRTTRPLSLGPVLARGALHGSDTSPSTPFVVGAASAKGTFLIGEVRKYQVVEIDDRGTIHRMFGRPELPAEYRALSERRTLIARMRRQMARVGALSPSLDSTLTAQARLPKAYFTVFAGDDIGRLWVLTGRSSEDGTAVDVFSPEGALLRSGRVPGEVRAMSLRLPRLVAVTGEIASADGRPNEVVLCNLAERGGGTTTAP